MLKIKYENTDISSNVDINSCVYIDSSGGIADSVTIKFNNTVSNWDKWKPNKGDKIEISKESITTGIMYIDSFSKADGIFTIGALSIPPKMKTKKSKTWENVSFLEVSNSLSRDSGFTVDTFDITNYIYPFLSQSEKSDLEMLNYLCIREGYSLKVFNSKIIIYDELKSEQKPVVANITSDGIKYKFSTKSEDIYASSEIKYLKDNGELIAAEFKPSVTPSGSGNILKIRNEQIYSISEGERYARGYLRNKNKFEKYGILSTVFNSAGTAGSTINLSGTGMYDNKYFIDKSVHDFVNNNSLTYVRGCLEGY